MATEIRTYKLKGSFIQDGKSIPFDADLRPGIPDVSFWGSQINGDKTEQINLLAGRLPELIESIKAVHQSNIENSYATSYLLGTGTDSLGEFELMYKEYWPDDKQQPDSTVLWFKRYIHDNPHSVIVIYIGKLIDKEISGNWYLSETNHGSFTATIV